MLNSCINGNVPLIIIATDKALFSSEKCLYLSDFSTKTYVVGTL